MLKNIIISSLCLGLLLGCKDDFLERTNPNELTSEIFWTTEEDFNKNLTVAYGALQANGVTGALHFVSDASKTDLGKATPWNQNGVQLNEFTQADNHPIVVAKWEGLYRGILATNELLENLRDADIPRFTLQEKTLMEGQAKFLRAINHFWIAWTYGKGLIVNSVPKVDADFQKKTQSKDEIINQLVIPDLHSAMKALPKRWEDPDDLGRVTQGAAYALLGKVYLYQKNYDSASYYFNKIINSGQYALVKTHLDNFTTSNEFNEESIFEVSYSETVKANVDAGAIDGPKGTENSGRPQQHASGKAGGWDQVNPSIWLHELFLNDSIDVTNPINTDNRWSSRAYSSIAFVGQDGEYYGEEEAIRKMFNNLYRSAYIKKGTNWYRGTSEIKSGPYSVKSGINERMIRYADILLMQAESILMNNGSVADALALIDQVRKRAGVITLEAYSTNNNGQIPQLHISRNAAGLHPTTPITRESLMTHLQRVERPLELCFEGHFIRWFDLVRWGIIKEVYTDLGSRKLEPDDRLIWELGENEVPTNQFSKTASLYKPEVHDFFPIPNNEVTANNLVGSN